MSSPPLPSSRFCGTLSASSSSCCIGSVRGDSPCNPLHSSSPNFYPPVPSYHSRGQASATHVIPPLPLPPSSAPPTWSARSASAITLVGQLPEEQPVVWGDSRLLPSLRTAQSEHQLRFPRGTSPTSPTRFTPTSSPLNTPPVFYTIEISPIHTPTNSSPKSCILSQVTASAVDPRIPRCQQIVRNWLCKLHRERNNCPARKHPFVKLILAERTLVRKLQLLVLHYIIPIERGHASETITKEDITNLCGEASQLLSLHTKILSKFEQLVNNWPCVDGVGKIFVELALNNELRFYGSYVEHSLVHADTLARLQDNDYVFAGWVQEKFLSLGEDMDLKELLEVPLNHIHLYATILRELIECTPPQNPDLTSLFEAESYLQKACTAVADAKARAIGVKNLVEAVYKFGGYSSSFQHDPKRQFVGDFDFTSPKNKTPWKAFVFSDQIIITSPRKDKKRTELFKPEGSIKFIDINDISEETESLSLTLTYLKRMKQVFKLDGPAKKNVVESIIRNKFERLNRKRNVFGSTLSELVHSEDRDEIGYPLIIERGLQYLESRISVVGLFRIPGPTADIARLRKLVQDDINFTFSDEEDPFSVGSLVKMYLREMAEPLFPFEYYERILALQCVDKQHFMEEMAVILQELPVNNQKTLIYLSDFMEILFAHSSTNRMTAYNTAIVVGPNLLRPAVETMDTALEMPKVNAVVAKYFENYKTLRPLFAP
ncbi:hypothetical protein Pelo_11779 [Pelomyxa schiedti]|nr:hypothetical protein Pelo_11779 [Pelomyxa schiedti]